MTVLRTLLVLRALSATVLPPPLELRIEAPTELAGRAAELRAVDPESLADVYELVGLAEPGSPIRVVLVTESDPLAANVPSWVSGYALGPTGTVVLFPDRVPSYPDRNLEVLLRHELTHVLTWRAAAGRPLPRWFVEGLATVAAREWGIEDRARTALAVIGRGPSSTAELDLAFVSGAGGVARAYALSAALVRHVQRQHGADGPARILALVAHEIPFRQAFAEVTGVTVAATERAFFGREAFWSTWVPFLTSSTALWMAVTLLALWAIRRRRLRDVAIRARWQEEDEAVRRAWADKLRRLREETDDPMRHN